MAAFASGVRNDQLYSRIRQRPLCPGSSAVVDCGSRQFQEDTLSSQIFDLIPKVMGDIGAIGKDRKNEQQRYSFRGIEDFYNAAHPAMVKHGVFCAPEVVEHKCDVFEKTNNDGKVTTWRHVTIRVKHRFYAPDGSSVDVTTMGEGLDNSDKATNKAMSGAMKYALIELFSVPTEDVEDADRTTYETGRANGNGKVPLIGKPIPLTPGVNNRAPILPEGKDAPEGYFITTEQQTKIHMRFADVLRPEVKSQAEQLLHDFLATKGFKDLRGNGSALAIPADKFAKTGKAAVEWGRTL